MLRILKLLMIYFFLFLLLMIVGCREEQQSQPHFPVVEGDYLGQTTPGLSPELFAQGIISTRFNERNAVFSPDKNELFFTLADANNNLGVIMRMNRGKFQWNTPHIAPFSGHFRDLNPFISGDGRSLYFISNRPLSGCGSVRPDMDIWMVNINGSPQVQNLGPVINSVSNESYISVNSLNTIYFASDRKNGSGLSDIYTARKKNGKYLTPQNLGVGINTSFNDEDPFISKDDRFLIFSSDRPGGQGGKDLYISFKKGDGTWSRVINMSNDINSQDSEYCPQVSPDKKYLFFSRSGGKTVFDPGLKLTDRRVLIKKLDSPKNGLGDIYWLDIKIIEKLKLNLDL